MPKKTDINRLYIQETLTSPTPHFQNQASFDTMNVVKPGNRKKFIVVSFGFIAFFSTLASINELQFDRLSNFSKCALSSSSSNNSPLPMNSSNDEIRILLGILTLPDQYQRRHFLRLIYGTQTVVGAKVDVRFVFCNTYFSSLPDMLKDDSDSANDGGGRPYPPYHYVMKGDDDAYFRLDKLAESLKPLPREDLYYGYVIPCPSMDPFVHYMSGMGYLISWDIVEWLRDSDIPKRHLEGPEDKVFGDWIREGHRGKNRYNAKWSMYNYPEPPTRCTHELWPDTVAVHLLKTQEKWIRTLQYFNVTQHLNPSKLYHIP